MHQTIIAQYILIKLIEIQIIMKFKSLLSILTLTVLTFAGYSQTFEGTVADEFGPLMEAEVKISGTDNGVLTDFDGKFSLTIPADQPTDIEISYTFYRTILLKGVTLAKGETLNRDLVMVMDTGEEGDSTGSGGPLDIVLNVQEDNVVILDEMRTKSASTMDMKGAKEIRQAGDNNIGAAVARIPGVSIEGGKYVYVRGLGDRYTKTVLNGLEIPGLDPDKNSIQLDIFPTTIVKNIAVYKAFTPNLPGDFTGGLVDIRTIDFPDKKSFEFSFGGSYNPAMHFNNNYVTYEGGKTDWLGYDDLTRNLPLSKYTKIPDEAVAGEELTTITRTFSQTMAAQSATSLMNMNFSASGGDSKKDTLFSKPVTAGYAASLSYRNNFVLYENAQFGRYTKDPDASENELFLQEDRKGKLAQRNVIWSALLSGGLQFKKARYGITVLHSQNGLSQTADRKRENFDQTGAVLLEDILTYTQRSVSNIMTRAEFNVENVQIEVSNAFTYSHISDPDFRTTAFAITTGDTLLALGDGAGVSRFWRNLQETNNQTKLDFTVPLTWFKKHKSQLKFGGSALFKGRDFSVQSYQFRVKGQTTFNGDPDYLFLPENIWTPETETGTYTVGNYEPANTFYAYQTTFGGYLMNDVSIKKLRAVYGARVEQTMMWYTGENNDGSEVYIDDLTLDALNVLPSASLIYKIKDSQPFDTLYQKMNLRASYNHTVARPSFKEKSIAQIFDPVSSRTFIGNIDLEQTNIVNYDLRWEYFFARGEVISVSAFHKQFDGHIELVPFETAPDNLKPRNSGQSDVTGIEFETRKTLGFLSDKLFNWGIGANVTIVNSRMDMNTVIVTNATETEPAVTEFESRNANARVGETIGQYRPMTGQAPYMINGSLNYGSRKFGINANLSYNVQGPTLTIVGVGLVPDVYTLPFHSLNFKVSKEFTKRFQLSFKANNILAQKRQLVFQSYHTETIVSPAYFSLLDPGTTFSVKATFNMMGAKKNEVPVEE